MNLSRLRSRLLFCLLCVCSIVSPAADSAAISGTVRDADGHILPNVTVSLAGRSAQQASSDSAGHFYFAGLPPGDYTLSAILSGYVAPAPQSIHLQSTGVFADVMLSRAAPLEFQSSGIRGLIDPGGYSASTASASASVLRGIAQLKRTGNTFAASATNWPCTLEPQLRQAVAQHPDQPEASVRLGQFYVAHNQPELAIPTLQHALVLDAASDPAARALASAWLEAGNFDAARETLTKMLATGKTAETYELLARVDEGSSLFQQAAEEYRQANVLSPSEESSFGMGYELLLSGSLAEASAAFVAGTSRYPRSLPMQIGAGTVHFLQGDTSAALQNFLAAAEIDPADLLPCPFLATTAAVSGEQRDRVRSALKHSLDLHPNSATANYFYAEVLSLVNSPADETKIEDLLKRAIQLDPTFAKAHLQLADMYARRNDFAASVPEYEATLRFTHDPQPHYRLGLAYKRLGRADDSAREMQLFLQSREADWLPDATPNNPAQFISLIKALDSPSSPAAQCPKIP